jgi:ribonuclease-3
VEESGPPHDRRFVYEVKFGEDLRESGDGTSKKEAQGAAAENLLRRLDGQRPR